MATQSEGTVVGVFEDSGRAAEAIKELMQRGFGRDKVGFAVRHDDLQKTLQSGNDTTAAPEQEEQEPRSKALARGVMGGVLGALDALLVPFIGPADASAVLGTTLPVAEEALDRLPYPGSHSAEAGATRPDAPMTVRDTPEKHEVHHEQRSVQAEERTGAVTGGIIGGVLGAAVALLIPGIGPAVAGGILATTFGGAAIGGVSGGFLSTFENLGIPANTARHYEQQLKAGHTIVTVLAGDREQEVSTILRLHDAHDVQTH